MKYIFILFFYSCIGCEISGQTGNDELAEDLENFISNQMEINNIPGLAASIIKDGQVVWSTAMGLANIETNSPVTLETEFTLASISKLFAATACAMLMEDGLLDLDADINDYLPFQISNPNFPNAPITTRQLLTHKSSLSDSESDLQLWIEIGDPVYSLGNFCEAYFIEGGALYNSGNWGSNGPGSSSYWYSNAGFTLLGFIVESVSEMPFNEYVNNTILAPLEMESAGWFYSEIDETDLAMPYNSNLIPYGYYSVPEYPAAMLKANVLELSNFLICYTQGGLFNNEPLFSQEIFQAIVPESLTNGLAWWGTDTWWGDPQGNYWSHGGYMNGVRTQLNYYPSDSTGLIILTNGEGSYNAIQNEIESYIDQFLVEDPTNIQERKIIDFVVYPNPTDLEIKLVFNENYIDVSKINLRTLSGNNLMTVIPNKSNFNIDVSHISTGTYILEIIYKGEVTTETISIL
ncbi:MAG: CubicO group peptidase (beta-lactamase class C family) [Patiriisocius sp.]|jgi:CubicO group peptidase (beta-lactamase class C family)